MSEFDDYYNSKPYPYVVESDEEKASTRANLKAAWDAAWYMSWNKAESSRYEALENAFNKLQRDYDRLTNEREMAERHLKFVLKRNETMSSGIEAMAMVFGENMFKNNF